MAVVCAKCGHANHKAASCLMAAPTSPHTSQVQKKAGLSAGQSFFRKPPAADVNAIAVTEDVLADDSDAWLQQDEPIGEEANYACDEVAEEDYAEAYYNCILTESVVGEVEFGSQDFQYSPGDPMPEIRLNSIVQSPEIMLDSGAGMCLAPSTAAWSCSGRYLARTNEASPTKWNLVCMSLEMQN